jgi:hypothetical protein
MLLAGKVAAVTSRIALCCHLDPWYQHYCEMAAATAEGSVGKKINYYTTSMGTLLHPEQF